MKVKIVSMRSVTTRLSGENLYLTEDEARDLRCQLNEVDIPQNPPRRDCSDVEGREVPGYVSSAPLPFTPLWQFEWYS